MFGSKSRAAARQVASIPQFLIASTPAAPADSHPVIDELADVAKDALSTLARSALAGAGRYFTARAERAEDERERRDYLDALHALRLSVSPVLRALAVELDRAFARPAPALPGPPPQITALCESLWQGVREQLEMLSSRFAVTPVAARFSPERIRLAARNCIARTDLDPRTTQLTQELLELGLMSHLDQVYRRIAERLEQYSLPGEPQFAVVANQPAPATPSTTLHVDPATRALLTRIAETRDANPAPGASYANTHLAVELLENLKSESGQSTMSVRTRAILQRLALVGRLMAAIADDPHVPPVFKLAFERLRFPMIKSALVDAAFLTERSHEMRALAEDLARKSLAPGAALETAIANAAADFDLSAAFVRPALAGLRPLTPAIIDKFVADLQDDSRERARLAAERGAERDRTESLRQRLAADLEIVAPPANEEQVDAESEPAAEEPMAAAPVAEPAPTVQLLQALLRSARWYRVYDRQQQKMRWLRLEAFYPERDSVAFTEFDGTNPLRMQAARFLEDLRSGRSAPCNPDADVRKLIQQLQQAA